MNHFPDVGWRRVVALSDLVNCQVAAIRLRTKRGDSKAKVLRGIL
jgi:hypothetical protein